MRGRGGRGGRYGGRSSATQELIRDNLEDLGFDITAIEDRSAGGPPPLYPPPTNNLCSVLLNPPIPDSEHKYAIDKTLEFSKRCFQSPYNLDNFINHNNVYNYPNNTNNNPNSNNNNKVPKELLELICQGKDEDYPYVPEELINGTNKKIFNVIKKRDVDFRRFEEAEEGKTEGYNYYYIYIYLKLYFNIINNFLFFIYRR